MDAVEFLKERKRMCLSFGIMCTGCPLDGNYCANIHDVSTEIYVKNVEAVEQWAKDHPAKTRQSEFLKMFPNANIDSDNDTIRIAPCNLDISIRDGDKCRKFNCAECCRDYWLQEVE